MNVQLQLKVVTIDAAFPRTFDGKISPIMSHGIGPKPNENPSIKMMQLTKGK